MTDDEHGAILGTCEAIHHDLSRIEGRLAGVPGRVDRFDEALHRARWERPPPRRDLDDRMARLDARLTRIERRDDREGPPPGELRP